MNKLQNKISVLEERLRNAMRTEYEIGTNSNLKEHSWSLYNNSLKEIMSLVENTTSGLLLDDLITKRLQQEIRNSEHIIEVILKSKFIDDMDKQDILNNLKNIEALNHVIKYLG
jgi:hypothetical protein